MTIKALSIAVAAHSRQTDKVGADYIHHPIRVAWNFPVDSDEWVVALLHDVLEDTAVTLDDLIAQGLTKAQADALIAITHLDNEPNVDYINRVAQDLIATRVKIADIEDNLSPERFDLLDDETKIRLQNKYDKALAILLT